MATSFVKKNRIDFRDPNFKRLFEEKKQQLINEGIFEKRKGLLVYNSDEWKKKFQKTSLWHLKSLSGKPTLSSIVKWSLQGQQRVDQYLRNRITIGAYMCEFTKGMTKDTWIKLKTVSVILIEKSIEVDPRNNIHLLPRPIK